MLLDLDLPDGNGLDLMPQLVADNAPVRIVILSMEGKVYLGQSVAQARAWPRSPPISASPTRPSPTPPVS